MIPVKTSVLIVEDERIVATDLQQTLNETGYDAFAIAASADEAIACATERCPDIVLMDIRIKGVRDGITAAGILKEKFDVPVVYLTAHADEATIERAKTTEPYGYLLKPVKQGELHSCLAISLHRHKREKELRERERWSSNTLRSITDGVVTMDVTEKVTFVNAAAEALIGLPSSEIAGKPASEVIRLIDGRSAEAQETPPKIALRMMEPVQLRDARLLNLSTGAQTLIDGTVSPVLDDDLTLGAAMVFRDVTQQKKIQEEAEFADRLTSLGTMAAGAAHELSNPLSVVVANAGLMAADLERHRDDLKAGLPPEDVERRLEAMSRALQDVQSAATRMGRIVSNLRIFSRPAQETPGLVDLARSIDWAVRATSHELQNRAHLISRINDVPLVKGDEARLGQVLVNLLVNAAQAIEPGHPGQNEVSVTSNTDEEGRAVIEISDTGAGIPPDVLSRIFDPFFTTKARTGTGLGLSICHGIVTSLGGTITVDSEVGKGSTFRVLLPPALEVPLEEAAQPGEKAKALRGRILAIDDEQMLLRIFGLILEEDHDHVVCVDNAAEAVAILKRGETFDVIFCDLMMPEMTGMEFYETLLIQNPDLTERIIFVSGGATTAEMGDFLRSIPNFVIDKPFTPDLILKLVQKVLAAARAELARAS